MGRIFSSAWKFSVIIVAVVSIDWVCWVVSLEDESLYDIEPRSCGWELPGKILFSLSFDFFDTSLLTSPVENAVSKS